MTLDRDYITKENTCIAFEKQERSDMIKSCSTENESTIKEYLL